MKKTCRAKGPTLIGGAAFLSFWRECIEPQKLSWSLSQAKEDGVHTYNTDIAATCLTLRLKKHLSYHRASPQFFVVVFVKGNMDKYLDFVFFKKIISTLTALVKL